MMQVNMKVALAYGRKRVTTDQEIHFVAEHCWARFTPSAQLAPFTQVPSSAPKVKYPKVNLIVLTYGTEQHLIPIALYDLEQVNANILKAITQYCSFKITEIFDSMPVLVDKFMKAATTIPERRIKLI
jgi:hypothetical protein